jgi:hypothetical protein
MNQFENRNESQSTFNQVKGVLVEINIPQEETASFGSITLDVGRSAKRKVNLVCKLDMLKKLNLQLGWLVMATFYISSKKKNERWHTVANVLQVDKL